MGFSVFVLEGGHLRIWGLGSFEFDHLGSLGSKKFGFQRLGI